MDGLTYGLDPGYILEPGIWKIHMRDDQNETFCTLTYAIHDPCELNIFIRDKMTIMGIMQLEDEDKYKITSKDL